MNLHLDIKHVDSWAEDDDILSSAIKRLEGPLEILEAGCGRKWALDLDGVDYRLTGIDLDACAMESRLETEGDLNEAIVADLSVPGSIEEGRYDVIFSSYVLEHIRDAEIALENMVNGLKSGGILLLRIPDRESAQGWTVRHTPFSVHVAYYRYIVGYRDAGSPVMGRIKRSMLLLSRAKAFAISVTTMGFRCSRNWATPLTSKAPM